MKERPILFSGPMVRAILDGSKTQTRRICKPQPEHHRRFINDGMAITKGGTTSSIHSPLVMALCPYGQPGDRLWVRESFWGCDLPGYGDQPCVVYDDEWHGKEYQPAEPRPWGRKFGRIPSIHMPRDCSRIDLEITRVRVERLQDISEADAEAEGVYMSGVCYGKTVLPSTATAVDRYRALWDLINGSGSWEANPWVWVVEFKQVRS